MCFLGRKQQKNNAGVHNGLRRRRGTAKLEDDLATHPHGAASISVLTVRCASAVHDAEVNEVRATRGGYVSVCRRRWCVEVLIVSNVEELATKLECNPLRDSNLLQDVGVEGEIPSRVVGISSFDQRTGGLVGGDLNEVNIVRGDATVIGGGYKVGILETGTADGAGDGEGTCVDWRLRIANVWT